MTTYFGATLLACIFYVLTAATPTLAQQQFKPPPTLSPALRSEAANAGRAASKQALRDLSNEYELVKVRLDTSLALANNIMLFVTAIAALLALYAVYLAVASSFGLKQITDNAKDELSSLRASIRESHPEIMDLQRSIRRMLDRMRSLLSPGIEWAEEGYSNLSNEQRQQILIAEMNFAGLEAFELERLDLYKPVLAGKQGAGTLLRLEIFSDQKVG